jgi:SAM-dependent methyltransferase
MRAAGDPYVAYTRTFFDRWSPLYGWFAGPVAPVYRAVARAAGAAPGRRILDLCAGTGELTRRLARRGAEVTAVDLTVSMLERGRRRGPRARWVRADARRLPFADGAFEVATLSFALHDMPARARAAVLGEAARVARERVLVLDYEPPRRGLGRRLVVAGLASFETPWLRSCVRGGVAAAASAAGLPPIRRLKRWPGLFTLHEIPLGEPSRPSGPTPPAG